MHSTTTTTTTNNNNNNSNPLRSRWNIGPEQLCSVAEVSVALKFFMETGLLALCSNLQPRGSGLHIYIPLETGWPSYTPRHSNNS
jgi:hypothetical protein